MLQNKQQKMPLKLLSEPNLQRKYYSTKPFANIQIEGAKTLNEVGTSFAITTPLPIGSTIS
jgi:hypothetical protein